jgi:hypothetical protein
LENVSARNIVERVILTSVADFWLVLQGHARKSTPDVAHYR